MRVRIPRPPLFFLLLVFVFARGWRRLRRKSLYAAIQASIRHLHRHEHQIFVHRHIPLPARAHHGSHQLGVRRIRDVKDIHAIKISLEQVVALERQIRVRKGQLRDRQMHLLGNLCRNLANAEQANRFLHSWIVRVRGTQLKCIGLLEQYQMLEAHRRLARVI